MAIAHIPANPYSCFQSEKRHNTTTVGLPSLSSLWRKAGVDAPLTFGFLRCCRAFGAVPAPSLSSMTEWSPADERADFPLLLEPRKTFSIALPIRPGVVTGKVIICSLWKSRRAERRRHSTVAQQPAACGTNTKQPLFSPPPARSPVLARVLGIAAGGKSGAFSGTNSSAEQRQRSEKSKSAKLNVDDNKRLRYRPDSQLPGCRDPPESRGIPCCSRSGGGKIGGGESNPRPSAPKAQAGLFCPCLPITLNAAESWA